jgi:hypothetical protein
VKSIVSLRIRRSPKQYTGETPADKLYQEGLQKGLSPKTAAKQAQIATGLSLLSGQRIKTKGFGWQQPIIKPIQPSL